MLRIAIVDDEEEVLVRISKIIQEAFLKNKVVFEIETFMNAKSLWQRHLETTFDVIFMDIMMPQYSGFQAAGKIRLVSPQTYLIFITSNEECVYDAFEFQPFQFVRKDESSIFENRIQHVVESLIRHLKQNKCITLSLTFSEKRRVPIHDIVAIKSDKNYLEYHLNDHSVLRIREKLSFAEQELADYDFIRVHNRWLINMRYIARIDYTNDEILMQFGQLVGLSRNYKKPLQEEYLKYLRCTR